MVCGKPQSELSPATASLNLGCLPRLFAWGAITILGLILWGSCAPLVSVVAKIFNGGTASVLGVPSSGVRLALLRLFDRALFWLLFATLVLHLIPGKTGANVRVGGVRLARDLWRLGLRALQVLAQAVVRFGHWVNGGESAAAKPRKAKKDGT